MYQTLLGLFSALIVLGASSAALAAGPEKCSIFTVHSDGSARKVTYVDHAPKGKSIGDQRIGYRAVTDKDGKPVGEHRWVATVVEVAQSGGQKDQTSSQGVFIFPKGTIFIARPPAPTFQVPENTGKVAGRGNYVVLGGSGIFQGVGGIVERTGDVSTPYKFHIRCG